MLVRHKLLSAIAGLALAGVFAPATHASFLATDPHSIPAFTGSEPFTGTGAAGTIIADVDYAVFAPGTYPGSGSITGADPSGGTQYVYAYLVNNLAQSTLAINLMSVGLYNGAITANASHNESLGGTAPVLQELPPASANAFLNVFPGIAVGTSSDIVLFTSPQPPILDSATMGNGGVNAQAMLPSPSVPEPASIALLVVGGSLMTLRRRRTHK